MRALRRRHGPFGSSCLVMTAIQSAVAEPAKGLLCWAVNSPSPVIRFATHHRFAGHRLRPPPRLAGLPPPLPPLGPPRPSAAARQPADPSSASPSSPPAPAAGG